MKKDLNYYRNLNYTIHIEEEIYFDETWFIAYCDELGRGSCYGTGTTQQEALLKFLKEKDNFIQYLFKNNKPIPEKEVQDETQE